MRVILCAISLVLYAVSFIAKAGEAHQFTRPDGEVLSAVQIDETVERLMGAGKVPGLALALISNNEITYLKAYGMAQ